MDQKLPVAIDIEGLPEGYSGLLFVVDPGFEAGIYQPMNELIAPSSTAHGRDHETIWAFVWPVTDEYKCCGWFSFDCLADVVIPDNADVAPAHQRRGIASSVYRFVRRVAGVDLVPAPVQSSDAIAMWNSLSPHAKRL